MKGIVFTELLEMIEEKFTSDMLDDILDDVDLPSGGAYSSVGTYDYAEALAIIGALHKKTNIPVSDLMETFGHHIFGVFTRGFSSFFENENSAIEFLGKVDQVIHVEVRKLYPDADLPEFTYEQPDEATFEMTYHSNKPFASLAKGMIEACIEYFKDPLKLEVIDLSENQGTDAKFILKKI